MGPAPSLLVAPELKYNGYIQGTYPLFTVLPGDRFRGNTGCAYGSSCYVTFRLDYMNSAGAVKTFWTWRESSDKKNNSFDLNLAPLAGQNVRFILTILATGSATNDKRYGRALYVRLDTRDGCRLHRPYQYTGPDTGYDRSINDPQFEDVRWLHWLGNGDISTNDGGVTRTTSPCRALPVLEAVS
jgi:hypothetical protein